MAATVEKALSRSEQFENNRPSGMKNRLFILILLALSLGVYAGTAGWPPLLDSSDAGHAEAAREMLRTHDW